MRTLFEDIRFGARLLARAPGFTLVAVVALALGIGSNTAMFTVVNSVLLRPLPFQQPSRLFMVFPAPRDSQPEPGVRAMSDPQYLEFARQSRVFEDLAAFNGWRFNLTGAGEPLHVQAAQVTASFFSLLGVNPALGRAFLPEEQEAGRSNVVVLGDRLWRSRFAGDPSVVGRTIRLDGTSRTVVGIMPASFVFPNNAEMWAPATLEPGNHHLAFRMVIGRLKPGVTLQQAQAEVESIARRMAQVVPEEYADQTTRILCLDEFVAGKIRPSLVVFLGAVGFVLLIACANVANLLLARAAARKQEMAVRASVGAGRLRLVRQLLTESALLAVVGGAVGVLIALWGVAALVALAPPHRIPRIEEIGMDGRVLGFTLLVSLATGLLFGLAPALAASQAPYQRLRAAASPRRRVAASGVLVVSEIALALVLLIGAGLMLRSFLRLRGVNPGFRPDNVLAMTVQLPENLYGASQQMKAFHQQTLARIASLPGVISAGAVNWLPLGPALIMGDFQIEGKPPLPPEFLVNKPVVSSHYFRAMGIRLLQGRYFDDRDTERSPRVAIVSAALARRFWSGENPIGKRITMQDRPTAGDWLTIVGVVDEVKQENLAEKSRPAIYQPYQQVSVKFFLESMTFLVRTRSNPAALAPLLRAQLREVDRDQPVQAMATMENLIAASAAEPRFQTRLVGAFSILALLLATVGIYGVMAYSVTQRTHEIGIRVALGAQAGDVLKMVLGKSMALVIAGVGLGSAGALALTRVLAQFLFEVKPTDPLTFSSVSLLVAAVALAASYIPARRAAKVDPMIALRYE